MIEQAGFTTTTFLYDAGMVNLSRTGARRCPSINSCSTRMWRRVCSTGHGKPGNLPLPSAVEVGAGR